MERYQEKVFRVTDPEGYRKRKEEIKWQKEENKRQEEERIQKEEERKEKDRLERARKQSEAAAEYATTKGFIKDSAKVIALGIVALGLIVFGVYILTAGLGFLSILYSVFIIGIGAVLGMAAYFGIKTNVDEAKRRIGKTK